MRIISQITMFDDTQNENLGDLEWLQMVLDALPDEGLIKKLEKKRGNGRDDWPVAAMWNSFIASFLFDHASIASLIRELNRNKQLRMICGFQPHWCTVWVKDDRHKGNKKKETKLVYAPSASAYTNFLDSLVECQEELKGIFTSLVSYMYENLEDFGTYLAVDGKAVQSFATKPAKKKGKRGEHDADWCKKTYTTTTDKGEKNTVTKKWFGFRLHLISDAEHELPVEFEVTKASNSEVKETEKMLEKMKEKQPEELNICKYFLADRGYDSTDLILWLQTEDVAPVIDIRNCWKDGETTRQFENKDIVYSYNGKVYYVTEAGEQIELVYRGYDKSRNCHRYGFHVKYHDNRIFRIPLKTDPRIFTKVARNSKKWKRIYKKRTSIERINGRIDRDFQFEKHTIRGLAKMKMFLTITLMLQLAAAKAKIERGIYTGLCRHCA